jgi:hypothetical protein
VKGSERVNAYLEKARRVSIPIFREIPRRNARLIKFRQYWLWIRCCLQNISGTILSGPQSIQNRTQWKRKNIIPERNNGVCAETPTAFCNPIENLHKSIHLVYQNDALSKPKCVQTTQVLSFIWHTIVVKATQLDVNKSIVLSCSSFRPKNHDPESFHTFGLNSVQR